MRDGMRSCAEFAHDIDAVEDGRMMRLDDAIKDTIKDARERARRMGRMDQRTISRISVVAAIVVVVLVVAVYGIIRNAAGAPSIAPSIACGAGTACTELGGTPAPGFTLTDQNGATVSLQALRGKPIALAFMYTHCPDVCPLTAEKMKLAAQQLGGQADSVAWVAISVDPANDTPDSAKQFAATHGLSGRLHFLMGSHEQLQPVWRSYFLVSGEGAPQGKVVDHTGAVYVIDKQGREQVYLDSGFDPVKQLAPELRMLLGT
jgi:protein SCO1/2